jgi:hypothetical protein
MSTFSAPLSSMRARAGVPQGSPTLGIVEKTWRFLRRRGLSKPSDDLRSNVSQLK